MRQQRLIWTSLILTAAVISTADFLDEGRVAAQASQTATPAPAIDPALFSGLHWRSIGPNRGGRSQAVAGSDSRPFEYYFGATGGGVWKTTDGGQTWRPVSDKFFKTSSVGAVAVAPSNPDVVYVGMGETELRGNIIQGDGVYKSTDAGKTWTHVGPREDAGDLRASASTRRIPTSCTSPRSGNPYGPNPGARRLPHRRTAARRGSASLFRDDKTGAVDLSMDPQESRRAVRRALGGLPHAALAVERRARERPVQEHRRRRALDRADEERRPAEADLGQGRRGGVRRRQQPPLRHHRRRRTAASSCPTTRAPRGSWSTTIGGFASARSTTRASTPTRRPRTRSTSSTPASIARPTPAKTIAAIRVPHGDNHDLWIAPNDPKRMINAQRRRRQRVGQRRRELDRPAFPTAQFYNVFTTAHVPYHVCGAQQDNSTACVPSNGNGDELYDVGGGESGYIAPDPLDADVFYAGSYGGLLTRINRRTGEQPRHQRLARQPDGPRLGRHDRALPVDLPDRHRADRSRQTLYVDVAARLEVDQRRPELAAHQPGPDAARSVDDGAFGRADHARSDRRRDLRRRSSRWRRRRSTATSSGPARTMGSCT